MATERQIERGIEWEPAAEALDFQQLQLPSPPFVRGTRRFTIRRNSDFAIEIEAHGHLPDASVLGQLQRSEDSILAGTFKDPSEVEFEAYGSILWMQAYFEDAPSSQSFDANGARFVQRASNVKFRRRWHQRFDVTGDRPAIVPVGEAAWRADWFVNGPHFPFMEFTKRRRSPTYSRERSIGGVVAHEPPGGDEARDHFVVRGEGLHFAVCNVPEEFAPPGCHPLSVDYPAPAPGDAEREGIAEILSFIFGRRLMQLGSSLFDSSGWTIEEEAFSPWGLATRDVFARGDIPPIDFPILSDERQRVLADLVPKYLTERHRLGLRDALLMYWLAKESVAGVELALYGSAVEALKNGWFRSSNSKSKGEYLPQVKFDELLGDLLQQARERILHASLPLAIANKLVGAYRMGGGEQMTACLNELGLAIGPAEKAAIKARNAPAHGGLRSGVNLRELVRHGNAYRTLFERAFLKILGYAGNYVDRTALGHPSHSIDEPCFGTAPA